MKNHFFCCIKENCYLCTVIRQNKCELFVYSIVRQLVSEVYREMMDNKPLYAPSGWLR